MVISFYLKVFLEKVKSKRGSVLLTTYLITTLLLGLGAAFLVIGSNEVKTADIQRKTTQAFYIAEAGIEQAIYDLRQDFVSDATDPTWTDGITISSTTYGPDTSAFYTIYSAVTFPSGSYTGSFSKAGTNNYTVSFKNVSASEDMWVRSIGVIDGVSQTIQLYVRMLSLSPWDNAIFGGAGSAGGMVNGNVNIAGSVHILGNGLADGDNAIDLGGTAELVGNNYSGLASALQDKIPALPTTVFNGESVSTLGAELRVKNGLVGLSGSSTVGTANVAGNGNKETVDGAYVTDGYNGNKGTANVYSDNGTSEEYDLGDAVEFPSLSDPYDTYTDYYDYFDQTGYTPTAGQMATLANIDPSGSDFEYGPTSDCSVDANCIKMESGVLTVKGKIYINGGTLGITGDTVEYTGSGTILVTGDVNIDENIVTQGDDSFPDNILGIMTPGNINIGAGAGAAQLDVMGLFYAETEIEVAKQTDLVGTIVTNYFDLTGQVPSVFQVPETVNNLPDGMISGDPVWLLKIISWQKL
jgi:hypothetical protein